FFFFSSRRRHTRCLSDWSSDVCSSDLTQPTWSTAGIAFRSGRSTLDGVYVMQPDGTNVHRVSAKAEFDADPAWSRDGRHLAYTRSEERRVGKGCRVGGAAWRVEDKKTA